VYKRQLEPTADAHTNVQFIAFLVAVIRAVDKHAPILRASVASAANDHRLGANEAPPAIISIFLGDMLSDLLEQLVEGNLNKTLVGGEMLLGARSLPSLPRHSGDRNRTSPFAFTGNKFEFRAGGSSSSVSWPLTVMNTIVADSLSDLNDEIERSVAAGDTYQDFATKVLGILSEITRKHLKVVFNGDNYSSEWHTEAEARGLPNLKNTEEALEVLVADDVVSIFEKFKVLSSKELASRKNTYIEQYRTALTIEAESMISIGRTLIIPSALDTIARLDASLPTIENVAGADCALFRNTSTLVNELNEFASCIDQLSDACDRFSDDPNISAYEELIPSMDRLREAGDNLERYCAESNWELPYYRDMLFVK
jgi:glutamine synthetase